MVMDVVERINELAAEEKCPHCDRDFHQGALTQRVAAMFERGTLDSQYFAREDTSPIVCDGSTFIGPLRPEPLPLGATYASGGVIGWSTGLDLSGMVLKFQELAESFSGITTVWPQYHYTTQKWILGADQSSPWMTYYDGSWNTLWTNKPLPCEESAGDLPEVDVEFGPQNWLTTERIDANNHPVQASVWKRWNDFQAIPTYAPEPRGYDFSAFTGELNNTGPKRDSVTKGRNK